MPIASSSSGMTYRRMPSFCDTYKACMGRGLMRMRENSSRTRSRDIFSSSAASSAMAAAVFVSIAKSSSAEMRTARNIRSASSLKRSFGSPTAAMSLRFISSRPPCMSTSEPVAGSYAIALMVKSRRLRSSSSFSLKVTSSGCRAFEYFPSMRYGVISMTLRRGSLESVTTPTVPKSFS